MPLNKKYKFYIYSQILFVGVFLLSGIAYAIGTFSVDGTGFKFNDSLIVNNQRSRDLEYLGGGSLNLFSSTNFEIRVGSGDSLTINNSHNDTVFKVFSDGALQFGDVSKGVGILKSDSSAEGAFMSISVGGSGKVFNNGIILHRSTDSSDWVNIGVRSNTNFEDAAFIGYNNTNNGLYVNSDDIIFLGNTGRTAASFATVTQAFDINGDRLSFGSNSNLINANNLIYLNNAVDSSYTRDLYAQDFYIDTDPTLDNHAVRRSWIHSQPYASDAAWELKKTNLQNGTVQVDWANILTRPTDANTGSLIDPIIPASPHQHGVIIETFYWNKWGNEWACDASGGGTYHITGCIPTGFIDRCNSDFTTNEYGRDDTHRYGYELSARGGNDYAKQYYPNYNETWYQGNIMLGAPDGTQFFTPVNAATTCTMNFHCPTGWTLVMGRADMNDTATTEFDLSAPSDILSSSTLDNVLTLDATQFTYTATGDDNSAVIMCAKLSNSVLH